MSSPNGYIGSIVVHLAVLGVAVLCGRLATAPATDVADQDPLLTMVWQSDGSDRAPGIPGREQGVAEGSDTGNKARTGLGGLVRVQKISADKLLRDMRENEAKAAAEAAKEAKEAKAEKAEKPSADDKSSKPVSKRESLADFQKANGKTTATSAKSTGSSSGKSTGTSARAGRPGITGASVGGGTGKGAGPDGFGRAGGKGKNGGEGGSGDAMKLFAGEVKGALGDIYIPLFRDQGGDIASDRAKGEVKLLVSSSGLVSFNGWVERPDDPQFERIVLEAIRKMRPVRPPPGGSAINIQIPLSGSLED